MMEAPSGTPSVLTLPRSLEAASRGMAPFLAALQAEILDRRFELFHDTAGLCPEGGQFDLDSVEMLRGEETRTEFTAVANLEYHEIRATGCCGLAPRTARSVEAVFTIQKSDGSVRVEFGDCTGTVTYENDFC